MVSLDQDGKTHPRGHVHLYTNLIQNGFSGVMSELLRTKTKNRSINLATTTTIWMEVKGRRTHMLSLSNNLEVSGDCYILRKQLEHHLASDSRGAYSQNNKYRHLQNHNDCTVSGLKL